MKICMVSLFLVAGFAHGASLTLDKVRKRGQLICGVAEGLPGFGQPDGKGGWSGIDIDLCRAVAAATLGDAKKIKFVPLNAKERFTALQSGAVDILSRNTTWTLQRDASLSLDFTGVTYYDGQGFMVKKKLKIKSVKQLNGATICVNTGTTTELNLADYFRANNLKFKMIAYEKNDEVVGAYLAGRCDAFSTDQSGLYAYKSAFKDPEEHVILPEIISKEPLGPAVRHGDNTWGDIVRWTLYAMLEAEEFGVNSGNVNSLKTSTTNPSVKRLLGLEGDLHKGLELDKDWVFRIIAQVGNYEDVFENNLGSKSPLKIARGQNALWSKGGLQYAMPIR
ncbi:MAG: amino acid ABC transporter substrate-binding protein [Pseudomonadota bacterium]